MRPHWLTFVGFVLLAWTYVLCFREVRPAQASTGDDVARVAAALERIERKLQCR